MQIKRLQVAGYRSIKNIDLKLHDLNVIVGANGTGKSNLYRSLYLLWAAANGNLASVMAKEGGMSSAMWAGKRGKHDAAKFRLQIEVDDLRYMIECGLSSGNKFQNDPDIKCEEVSTLRKEQRIKLLGRNRGAIEARGRDAKLIEYPILGNPFESVLASLRAPHLFPDLSILREEILNWRFYHHFRTDLKSPLRTVQVPAFSPVLSDDGVNLASALETIIQIGGGQELLYHLNNAFPGARLRTEITFSEATFSLKMPGLNRPFTPKELSDGTLQYLCLLAALLTERPPNLLILNEPETSIHPDLFEPLAELLVAASHRSQVIVTTHARDLAVGIMRRGGPKPIELEKRNGETCIVGAKLVSFDNDDVDL